MVPGAAGVEAAGEEAAGELEVAVVDDDEPQAFALRSVALMRDSVWWMTRCEEFKSWELAEG